jgi:hypothetical protein
MNVDKGVDSVVIRYPGLEGGNYHTQKKQPVNSLRTSQGEMIRGESKTRWWMGETEEMSGYYMYNKFIIVRCSVLRSR